jgi:hypothetical protein
VAHGSPFLSPEQVEEKERELFFVSEERNYEGDREERLHAFIGVLTYEPPMRGMVKGIIANSPATKH